MASAVCDNTPLNTDLTGDLNASVTDPDSPVLSFALATQGAEGIATIDPTGVFTYTPNPGARGTDSFTYQVDDLAGGQDTATVMVIIGDTRIMPLGDSITEGVSDGSIPAAQRVGYRRKLYDDLDSTGFNIDFVGSLSNGSSANPAIADPHHEGHFGFEDRDVAINIFTWLTNNQADIVLLHIGTNPTVIDTDPGDVQIILDEIDNWEALNNPVTVFLARIIDRNPIDPDVEVYNDNVQTMALARGNDDIFMVNQHDALIYPDDLLADPLGLHPDGNGYIRMADTWLQRVTSSGAVPKCP